MLEMRAGKHKHAAEGKHATNPVLYSLQIGLFAGLIFGVLRWLIYEMKFTKELPGFLLQPFFKDTFLHTSWGYLAGIAGFTLFSMAAALLYKVALGKLRGPWPGIGYGLAWWAIIFPGLGPMAGLNEKINTAGWNTFYSELCTFIIWGLFIGYSIAFEFTNEASREPMGAS